MCTFTLSHFFQFEDVGDYMDRNGFKLARSVMLGYFPIAITFGILAKNASVSTLDGVAMSIFVFAGASQFMAISMIGAKIGSVPIILATFFMNFRHFIMSASIRQKVTKINKKYYPFIGFFLTDETFSVLITKDSLESKNYLLSFQISCYLSWVLGTLVGYLVGTFFPPILITSLGMALYALFIALLIPACKKSTQALILALSAGLLNTLLQKISFIHQNSSFMISVLSISLLASIFL